MAGLAEDAGLKWKQHRSLYTVHGCSASRGINRLKFSFSAMG